MLAVREIILKHNPDLTEAWKYSMPFFCYKKKMLCYCWIQKKTGQPYIGFVDGNKIVHPKLIAEKRSRIKIMLLDVEKDLPVKAIKEVLTKSLTMRTS